MTWALDITTDLIADRCHTQRVKGSASYCSILVLSPAPSEGQEAAWEQIDEGVMIRLLLVDDQPTVRRGLGLRFHLEPDLEVIGEASTGTEALALAQTLTPDVVLMDIAMPEMDGIEATAALRRMAPQSAVVILSIHDDAQTRAQAQETLASVGRILKIRPHKYVDCHEMAERRKQMAIFSQRKQTKRSGLQASRPPRGEAPDHTPPPKRSKTLWRRTRRILLIVALVIVSLSLTGFLYQTIASAVDTSSYPAPGRLIDVGGYHLHLYCTGTARLGSPSVILEAGYGDTSLVWSKVQPGVASFTRMCSYDRAGYGWSDNGPLPRTAGHMVRELHTLLARAGVAGPSVLVGHSYGGLIMQLYASTYPQQVAGLVLVESMHEDQFRYPELHFGATPPICQALAPFGIMRLFGLAPGYVAEYPPTAQPAAKAQFYQTRFCQTASDEYAALDESFAQVRAARHPLGHLPLVVLTHGLPYLGPPGERDWQALQRDLASFSSHSLYIIATRSGHLIQLEQPDLVIAAIKQVLTGKV
jgi:DNA-binding NarL/FixJ family response regulator/pimeloyl-ACP methyl ester carboxylesterase